MHGCVHMCKMFSAVSRQVHAVRCWAGLLVSAGPWKKNCDGAEEQVILLYKLLLCHVNVVFRYIHPPFVPQFTFVPLLDHIKCIRSSYFALVYSNITHVDSYKNI